MRRKASMHHRYIQQFCAEKVWKTLCPFASQPASFNQPGTKSITENMNNMINIPKSALMMNQFLMIDIINTNLGTPISFTYDESLFSNLLKLIGYGYEMKLKG